jgi:serine/threonine-protein kinase
VTVPPASRVGEVIAKKYALEELLGAGGMGEVYRATNTHFGRTVAIKLLRAEHVRNEGILNRFLQEARAANLVRHVNVVDVLDMGRDEQGCPFIVQEYLDGLDLRSYLKKGPTRKLPIDDALDILIPIADAVGVAHARGVVHRDLKPGNIFLADVGGRRVPKVLDFGVSQIMATAADARITQTGEAIGTPAYMSPEQIQNPKQVDAGSDVWSLGVILYELIAGHHPYTSGDSAPGGVFVRIATQDPVPIEQVEPRVPHDLARVVRRCLRRKREERYPTALELARDLQHIKRGDPIEPTQKISTPPPPLKRPPPAPALPAPAAPEPESYTVSGLTGVQTSDLEHDIKIGAPLSSSRQPAAPPVAPAEVPDLDLGAVRSSARVPAAPPAPAPGSNPNLGPPSSGPALAAPRASSAGFAAAPAPPPPPQRSDPALGTGMRMIGGDDFDDDEFQVERGSALAAQHVSSARMPAGSISGVRADALEVDDPRKRKQLRHDVRKPSPARFDWSPLVAALVCALTFTAVTGATWRLLHDPSGWRVMAALPTAFDGHSPVASGITALLAGAACLTAALVGLLRSPRRAGLVLTGIAMFVVAMAMIVVTFAAISAEPETPAPDAGRLVPFALPAAGVGLVVWLLRLAYERWLEESAAKKAAAIALVVLASLAAFGSVELLVGAIGA